MINEEWIPKPEWSQTRYLKYGFGKLFIHNQTHLELKTVLLDHTSQGEADSFMIIRLFQ